MAFYERCRGAARHVGAGEHVLKPHRVPTAHGGRVSCPGREHPGAGLYAAQPGHRRLGFGGLLVVRFRVIFMGIAVFLIAAAPLIKKVPDGRECLKKESRLAD